MGIPEEDTTPPAPSIVTAKAELRRLARRRLAAMGESERATAFARAVRRLGRHPLLARARSVALFAPTPGEPPVLDLLPALAAAGRRWLLPAWDTARRRYRLAWGAAGGPWSKGPDGIPQPRRLRWAAPHSVDAIVVPGVAFGPDGARLGRGGGHYDRLLSEYPRPTIGVTVEALLLPNIPVAPHDRRVGWVVTDRRCIECSAVKRRRRDGGEKGRKP